MPRLIVHLLALCMVAIAAPATAKGPLIWALGDSLTAGYGVPSNKGFTAQLQAALRKDGIQATVRNGGVSGETISQGRARLAWGLRGLGAKPDLVIVELGANDMLRGLPVGQARTNLERILAELKRRDIKVLVAGMKASPNLGPQYRREFDSIFPELAAKYGASLYPFFLEGVANVRALNQKDGLHPNAQGVAVIVRNILPSVKQALAR